MNILPQFLTVVIEGEKHIVKDIHILQVLITQHRIRLLVIDTIETFVGQKPYTAHRINKQVLQRIMCTQFSNDAIYIGNELLSHQIHTSQRASVLQPNMMLSVKIQTIITLIARKLILHFMACTDMGKVGTIVKIQVANG